MRHALAVCLCVTALTGCESSGLVYNAAYVGDRLNVPLGEVVVTVPAAGADARPVNLHVSLTAVMNPRRAGLSAYADAEAIIRRMTPRISSAIIARVEQEKAISHADLPTLRLTVLREAEGVLRQAMARWARAADFNIELLATSFYLTDGGGARVPPPPQPRPGPK